MSRAFAVDSSALIAIINREPEAAELEHAPLHGNRYIGWPTVFETRIWIFRRGAAEIGAWFQALLDLDTTLTIPFDGPLEASATDAFNRFGKGRHQAKLNFGDCMTYSVAQSLGIPLLFKGGDFGKTDIAIHPASVITEPVDT